MSQSFSLTRALSEFEREWNSAPPPAIESHLAGTPSDRRKALLQEFVCIDMEYRWQRLAGSQVSGALSVSASAATRELGAESTIPALLVDDYLAQFPELGDAATVDSLLIEEEFRVRSRWGDQPDVTEFLARFPHQANGLKSRLEEVRCEAVSPATSSDAGSEISVEELLSRIAASRLLLEDGILKLRMQLQAAEPFADGRQAGEWLVAQKKLTDGQLRILLKGPTCPLVLGSYVILDEIGAGGMGQVYKALHSEMQREVALKTLKSSLPVTSDSAQRFQREVQAAARLVHPNVVVAHDAGEVDGVRFLVMEYVEGQNLSTLVRQSGAMPLARAVDLIQQAAEGLKYAHQRGVVHRDVKPGNLLLSDEGVVKVLDLGLARFSLPHDQAADLHGEPLTSAGMVMGTADYMAPEQASETRTADERADIYSLGCTLHFLLTGKRVFPEKTVWQTLSSHLDKPIPSLHEQRADMPQALDDAFQKMLAKKTADRFQTMQEVIDSLGSIDPARLLGAAAPGNMAATDSTVKTSDVAERFSESDATLVLEREQSQSQGKQRLLAGIVTLAAVAGIAIWAGSSNSTVTDGKVSSADSGINATLDPASGETGERPVGRAVDLSSIAAQRDEVLSALWATENSDDRQQLLAKVAGLPSPLDSLRKEDIPQEMFRDATQYDQTGFLRDNLVAVLGNGETQHWNRILGVAFTNDSKRVISASEDGTVIVRDALSGEILKRLIVDGVVSAIALSSDDQSLFLYLSDKVAIEEWNLDSYERVWRLAKPDRISSLACSVNGRWLAAGGYGTGLHLLNRETNIWEDYPFEGNGRAMAFCGDDRWLAIGHGSSKPGIAIFDLQNLVFSDPLDVDFCNSIQVSADGERLFANDIEFLTVWNASDWSVASKVKLTGSSSMALRHDGSALATMHLDSQGLSREIGVFDATSGTTIGRFDWPDFLDVWSLDFSNDGSRLAAGSSNGLYVWDTSSRKRVLYSESDHQGTIEKLSVHPDSSILAASDSLRRIRQWKLTTGELLSTARLTTSGGKPLAIADLKFSPDGNHLAVAGVERALRYLVPESGKLYRQFPVSDQATSLSFSPDSSRLYTTHLSGNCAERDARTSEIQRTIQITDGVVRRVSADVSRDGKWLAAGWEIIGGHGMRIVDLQSGKPTEGLRDGLASLSFTPDLQSILAGADQKFILARRSDPTTEMTLPGDPRAGRGLFRLSEYAVAVNPLTGDLVGASNTGALHFWTPSGNPLRTVFIGPPGGRIPDLEFTPDGRYLITANGNGTMYVLRMNP